tara:strand:- start:36391 stop:36924 length:534 start_codon:yes stop_codon:yes gene_type:complete
MGCGCGNKGSKQSPQVNANPQTGFTSSPAMVTPPGGAKVDIKDGIVKTVTTGLSPGDSDYIKQNAVTGGGKSVTAHPITDKEKARREEAHKASEPGLLKKALSLGEAIVDHVADGMTKTTKEELGLRLSLCDECHHKTSKNTCNLCGCGIATKAGWRSSECPDGRWPLLKETDHGNN